MDAFFASVEQRDNPALRGRPLAVGHSGQRGVVATASYEARRYGVRSAMPSTRAARLCPQLVWVEPHFEHYKAVSAQMHDIFHEYTDIIEPISLDEAFLDVTVNKPGIGMAVDIAREIKEKIRERLHLTASAGVSYNKFLAKIASDLRKPDGLCTIHPDRAREFIDRIPVKDFWGVGPVTAAKMTEMGICNGADLRQVPLEVLCREFGRAGELFYNFARGLDERPVQPERERKSVGCENTFLHDITDSGSLLEQLRLLADDLESRLDRRDFRGTVLTLKLKYADFTVRSRSLTGRQPFVTAESLYMAAMGLLEGVYQEGEAVRLAGLTVSIAEHPRRQPRHDPRQLRFDFHKLLDSNGCISDSE